MKKVYILLTRSTTVLSKTIVTITNAKYTHSSIGFDRQLEQMYSFGRLYPRLPFPGNIKKESLYKGFYKIYNNIPCALLEINVTNDQYDNLLTRSIEMLSNKQDYSYSVLGLIGCVFNIKRRSTHKYTCSHFVSDILQRENVIQINKHPSLVRPVDFLSMKECKLIYEGTLDNINISQ